MYFKMNVIWWLLSITLLSAFGETFRYEDLKALNASCGQKDSCGRDKSSRLAFPSNWKERNCFCDALCGEYGDCCLDAITYDKQDQSIAGQSHSCVELRNYGGVYMRHKCSLGWKRSDASKDGGVVEELCAAATPQSGYDRRDPFLSMPVTSSKTRITYTNFYCAVCNEDTDHVHVWKPRIECPSLTDIELRETLNTTEVLQSLAFNNGSWTLPLNISGSEEEYLCTVDPFIPDFIIDEVRLCKPNLVSRCLDKFKDTELEELCDSYTAIVYQGQETFRNYHCALCNDELPERLSCYSRQFIRFNFKDEFNPAAFSILLDFQNINGVNNIGARCKDNEVWDPFFSKCRLVKCANETSTYRLGRCLNIEPILPSLEMTTPPSENDRLVYIITSNNTVQSNDTHNSQNIIVFPDEIVSPEKAMMSTTTESSRTSSLNCNRILLPYGEFERRENGSIFVAKYDRVLSRTQHEQHEDGVLVCLTFSETRKFSDLMGWLSLAGLGLSLLCLILHLAAFLLVADFQNLSGKNMACLCICLVAGYTCFILSVFGEEGELECIVVGSCMYYFFLASFCWMNVMAFDVWKTLRNATSELRLASGGQWLKFFLYSIYAWAVPGIALTLLLVIDKIQWESFPPSYLPRMGERLCWFGQRKALLVFFAAPLTGIMLLNIAFFILSARMIASTALATAKYSSHRKSHSLFKLYMRLALLMGLGWIIGIMAGYLQQEVLWYMFILLNTLQGCFIFITFTCKKKVLNLLRCNRAFRKLTIRPMIASARRNLTARHSSESQASRSSNAILSPRPDTSSTSIDL